MPTKRSRANQREIAQAKQMYTWETRLAQRDANKAGQSKQNRGKQRNGTRGKPEVASRLSQRDANKAEQSKQNGGKQRNGTRRKPEVASRLAQRDANKAEQSKQNRGKQRNETRGKPEVASRTERSSETVHAGNLRGHGDRQRDRQANKGKTK